MASDLFDTIRRALGRSHKPEAPPAPPAIDEPIVRLVHTDFGLPELFARMARRNGMDVDALFVDELQPKLIEFLHAHGCRKPVLPVSAFLKKLGLAAALCKAGLAARWWDELPADAADGFDCGITDTYAAVAETGSIVLRPAPGHGRAIALSPVHIAILQPKDFVADLADLMAKLRKDGQAGDTVIISGPRGMGGREDAAVAGGGRPGVLKVFLLQ